jgi:multidrug efflux pump subunit AcrB
MTIEPQFAPAQASITGLDLPGLAATVRQGFEGLQTGVFRERDELIPIVVRAPAEERGEISNIRNMQIWSPAARSFIPIRQIVNSFETKWEDGIIMRRNRKPTITVHADQMSGSSDALLARVRPKLEALDLPAGFVIEYGGEYESSSEGQQALANSIPTFGILMVLIVVMLFNSLRQPLIIFLMVPLALIGVTAGLLSTRQPFGFMALLGFLSLSGMLIKNAIVLIDQIDLEIREGKEPGLAILDAAASRLRPVSMAALTTILGMIPLLADAFFIAMAVTIMAGLAVATFVTMLVIPVLYATLFRIRMPDSR